MKARKQRFNVSAQKEAFGMKDQAAQARMLKNAVNHWVTTKADEKTRDEFSGVSLDPRDNGKVGIELICTAEAARKIQKAIPQISSVSVDMCGTPVI